MVYVIIGILILIKVYIYFSVFTPDKNIKRGINSLASEFGTKIKQFSSIETQFSGYSFILKAHNQKLILSLSLRKRSNLKLKIYSRSISPVFFMKRLKHFAVDHDSNYAIYSNDLIAARNYLEAENNRQVLLSLIDNCQQKGDANNDGSGNAIDKDLVIIDLNKIRISISFQAREAVLNSIFIRDRLEEMIVLSRRL